MFKSIGSLAPIILIFSILLFAIKNKIQIFDSFINGAREGIECIFSILPILVGSPKFLTESLVTDESIVS